MRWKPFGSTWSRKRRALPIVLPAETDMGLVKIEQAAVSNRDAMRVAREISQDLLRTGEGLFGIDDPFRRLQWCEVGSELVRVLESGDSRTRPFFTLSM